MKNYILILLFATIVVIGCNNNRSESRPIDKRVSLLIGKIKRGEIALPADSTLLDLFYGMERSKEFSGYMQRDTILENTPNIVKSENTAWWYYNPDKMKFRSTLGLYIDKDYPSQKVFQRLEEAIDTTMVNGLSSMLVEIICHKIMQTYSSLLIHCLTKQLKACSPTYLNLNMIIISILESALLPIRYLSRRVFLLICLNQVVTIMALVDARATLYI